MIITMCTKIVHKSQLMIYSIKPFALGKFYRRLTKIQPFSHTSYHHCKQNVADMQRRGQIKISGRVKLKKLSDFSGLADYFYCILSITSFANH